MYIDLKQRLKYGLTWNVIGSLFSQGTLFVTNVVLANILGKTGFGEFGMIQTTIITVAGIAQLATGFTATKYVAEYRLTDKKKTGRILGICSVITIALGTLATLLMLAGAPWLADITLKAPNLSTGLMIGSGAVLFSVLTGYQVGALAGMERFGTIAKIGAIHGMFHLAVCAVSAWLWGVNGALAGFVISALMRWLMYQKALAHGCVDQDIAISYQGLWNEREIITKFALPAALSGLVSMPALWLVNTFLARLADGYSELGMYSAANSLKSIILLLPQLINNVSMSLMNSQKGLGNKENYRKLFWVNMGITLSVALAGVVFVVLFGSTVLRIYGKDFVAGHTLLIILAMSAIPEALALAAYQKVHSQGKMWLSFAAIVLPRDITYMLLGYFLVPQFGAIGMASAYAASQTVSLFVTALIVYWIGFESNVDGSNIKR